jgi:hypothetical protein
MAVEDLLKPLTAEERRVKNEELKKRTVTMVPPAEAVETPVKPVEVVDRAALIQTAVTFLQSPNVANAPWEKREQFLKGKGLTDAEIQRAKDLASDTDLPPIAAPPPPVDVPAVLPPPPAPFAVTVTRQRSARSLLWMVLAGGTSVYLLVNALMVSFCMRIHVGRGWSCHASVPF